MGVFAGGERKQPVAVFGGIAGVVGASCHTLRNELVELFFVHIGVFVVAEGFIVGVK